MLKAWPILLGIVVAAWAPREECVIAIQPLGDVRTEVATELATGLQLTFACDVLVLPGIDLPQAAYYPPRNRYRADQLLPALAALARPGRKVLGLTAVDISVTKGQHPDWGVFGYASLSGEACVVSSFRLGRRPSSDHSLSERLLKLAIHEIGHTLGLPHCRDPRCVMRDYEGRIISVDVSERHFCSDCRKQVARFLHPGTRGRR